jgi:hypothetical protein
MLTYFKAIRPRQGFTVDMDIWTSLQLQAHTQRSYLHKYEAAVLNGKPVLKR